MTTTRRTTTSSSASSSSKAAVLAGSSSTTSTSGPTFATSAVRSKDTVALTKAQFPKSYRASATAEECMKICKEACTGSSTKLKKVDYTKMVTDSFSDDQFDNIVEMTTFLSTMKQHFIRYDMSHFFVNFPNLDSSEISDPSDDHDRFRNGKTVNLFDRWNQIGVKKDFILNTIADVVGWIQLYTDSSLIAYLEDLEWTHKYLMDSMSPDLAIAVQSTLDDNYPPHQHGGPLTFAVMLDLAVNLSSSVITNIQASICTYNITNVPGEDVELVARRLLHVFRSLENNRSLSSDLVHHLFTLLSSTSVSRFNNLIQQWENSVLMEAEPMPSYQEILKKAVSYYKRLTALNAWTASESTGSAFTSSTDRKGPIKCHNCGGDHLWPDCPLLRKRKSEWVLPPDESMMVCKDPPRYEKTIGKRLVKFCSKCSKWTTTHYSDEHHGGKPKESANLASVPTEAGTPKADDNSESKPASFKDTLLSANVASSST